MSSSSIIAARPRQRPSGPSWSFVCHGRVARAAVKRKKAPRCEGAFLFTAGNRLRNHRDRDPRLRWRPSRLESRQAPAVGPVMFSVAGILTFTWSAPATSPGAEPA